MISREVVIRNIGIVTCMGLVKGAYEGEPPLQPSRDKHEV